MRDDPQPFQYRVGDTLTLRSHHPPPPVPRSELQRRARTEKWEESSSPIELCIRDPPLAGLNGSDLVGIKLMDELHVGDDKSAQLFVARSIKSPQSLGLPTNEDMVAKIYDPLYHDFAGFPFVAVDYEYTNETAVYTHLSDLQGSVIPRYFGSFSLKIKVGRRFRMARLVLIERIDGVSMNSIKPETLPIEKRKEILKHIINVESSIYTKDVIHGDLHPRNVIVINHEDLRTLRVVFIDFGRSVIGRSRNPQDPNEEQRWLPGTAISPLLRWNEQYNRPDCFFEWIDWPLQPWLDDQYKETEATITQEQRGLFPVFEEEDSSSAFYPSEDEESLPDPIHRGQHESPETEGGVAPRGDSPHFIFLSKPRDSPTTTDSLD